MSDASAVLGLRLALWDNGYRPVAIYSPGAQTRKGIPIKGAGKRPVTNDWLELARRDPPDAVVRAASSLALNTGVVTGQVVGCDVDVLLEHVVAEIASRIEASLGETPLRRIGRPPKILLCYRAEEPFSKLSTATFRMPDGSLAHFEILGQGQQFVAFGTHPDTMQPYQWLERSPLDLPLAELPTITAMQARDLIGEAEAILLAAGGVLLKPPDPPREPAPPPRSSSPDQSGHESFFRAVNNAALKNIAAWAQALHADFRDHKKSGWRLTSKKLGRDLEEDIAIHPDGIRDFGEERTLTAVDGVIKFGAAADAVTAAFWLCGKLGVKPESLGWRSPASGDTKPAAGPGKPQPARGNGHNPAYTSVGDSAGGMDGSGTSAGELSPPPSEPDEEKPNDDVDDDEEAPEPPGGFPRLDWGIPGSDDDDVIAKRDKSLRRYARLIDYFNQRYAAVNEAGRFWIFEQRRDDILHRDVLDHIKRGDFCALYENRRLAVWIEDAEKYVSKTWAEWWLKDVRRRQYDGVVLDPTCLHSAGLWNLWRDFGVSPAPGDWSLMQRHIERVICSGVTAWSEYLFNWVAYMVQHPDRPGEVAIVLRGDEGTGKGILGRTLAALLGTHGLQITDAGDFTGRFNEHLRDLVFLFADEAFFAGDKKHEGRLKALITEPSLTIEGKFKAVITVRNRLHIFISSNSDWVVPASLRARRWFALKVLDTHIRDTAYFGAIQQQLDNGGLAAMLYDMLHRDLDGFDVRNVPPTDDLHVQKALSLSSLERWWMAALERGFLWKSRHGAPWFHDWHDFYTTELLERSYQQWCEESRPFDRKNRQQLGMFFTDAYRWSRRAIKHPVYEVDSIDRAELRDVYAGGVLIHPRKSLDEIAIVTKPDQCGYQVGELDEARARFLDTHAIAAPPWQEPN